MRNAVFFLILIGWLAGCKHTATVEPATEPEMKVKTAVVQSVQDEITLSYSGTVEPSQVIPLSFRTAGTVERIYVDVGDAVRNGQLLATLDDSDLQSIYSTTLARYQQAEDAYNRLKQVYDEGSLPEIKWVEMKSNMEQAASALEMSKNNLGKCKLVAPTDGIVGRRNIEPGQSSILLTGAPIELVKIETVLVKISVPENEINRIREGQKAIVSVSALGGKMTEGTVTNISPIAELMSRTYTVKITVQNEGRDLKPGMVCDVGMNIEPATSALVVPYRAVSKDSDGKTYVFAVTTDNQRVRKQYISVGQYHGSGIEILDGLTEGQVVVVEGGNKLSDNSKINL